MTYGYHWAKHIPSIIGLEEAVKDFLRSRADTEVVSVSHTRENDGTYSIFITYRES